MKQKMEVKLELLSGKLYFLCNVDTTQKIIALFNTNNDILKDIQRFLAVKREEYEWAKANDKKILMQVLRESVKKTIKQNNLKFQPYQLELF